LKLFAGFGSDGTELAMKYGKTKKGGFPGSGRFIRERCAGGDKAAPAPIFHQTGGRTPRYQKEKKR
jgi:hypothetical protein